MKKHLEKVCADYCLSASDVYTILLSRNDEDFPLSFDTVRNKVLKDVSIDILKEIFTQEELKNIFHDIISKKLKILKLESLLAQLLSKLYSCDVNCDASLIRYLSK